MKIIPVIDLKGGVVVRGLAGRRNEYRTIESPLVADARPRSVAEAIASLGFSDCYLADLDAIGGAEPAWPIYEDLLSLGLNLWIDAGLNTASRLSVMAQFAQRQSGVHTVAGLESLPTTELLTEMLRIIGHERLVLSLDLKSGQPLNKPQVWPGLKAIAIARRAVDLGVRRMIVLDLAHVGVGEGVGTLPLCRQLRREFSALQLICGGGVRDADDLQELAAAGCDAALVASALHDGRIRSPR